MRGFSFSADQPVGENRLISVSAGTTQIAYTYDGDGNRVQKVLTIGAGTPVTTRYLVDTNNLTGYAQVVEELDGSNNVQRVFTYGLDLISQDVLMADSSWKPSYYLYDGTGSVRALTDTSGNITDTYDYSAFGELIGQTHVGLPTSNNYLFQGEQLDSDTGFYYQRARFMNPTIGRFQTMDNVETINHYWAFDDDPCNKTDPSGFQADAASLNVAIGMQSSLSFHPKVTAPSSVWKAGVWVGQM